MALKLVQASTLYLVHYISIRYVLNTEVVFMLAETMEK